MTFCAGGVAAIGARGAGCHPLCAQEYPPAKTMNESGIGSLEILFSWLPVEMCSRHGTLASTDRFESWPLNPGRSWGEVVPTILDAVGHLLCDSSDVDDAC